MRMKLQTGLMAVDAVLVNVAFYLAYIIRYEWQFPTEVLPQYDARFIDAYIPYALLLTALCLLTYAIDGLYEMRPRRSWLGDLYRLISSTMTSIVLVMAITFFVQPLVYSRGMLILAGIMIVVFLAGVRMLHSMISAYQRRHGEGVARVVIVGAGELGRSVIRAILADPAPYYHIVGYLDDDPSKGERDLGRIKGLGSTDTLEEVIHTHAIDEVIVTLPWMYHRRMVQIIEVCNQQGLRTHIVPDVYQQRFRRVDLDTLNGIPLVNAGGHDRLNERGSLLIKRVIDVLLTVVALPFFFVVTGIIALVIKLDSKGPIFFKQERVGQDGKPFEVYKFRTMVDGAERMVDVVAEENITGGPTLKVPDDPRRTRVGAFLRKTSLDELPQIINIVRGEMSWVGPRPAIPEEVAQYEPWQRRRLDARPGITGLWQVSGRSNIPFAEMCLLDIFYIENWTPELELLIILRTIPSVLLARGAY